jgi:hypothetical protein
MLQKYITFMKNGKKIEKNNQYMLKNTIFAPRNL